MLGILLRLVPAYLVLLTTPVFGISLLDSIGAPSFSQDESKRVFLHSNNSQYTGLSLQNGYGLQNNPTDLITQYLQGIGLDRTFQLQLEKHSKSHQNGHQEYRYSFKVGEIPVCEHSIKAHLFDQDAPIVTGSFPLAELDRDNYPPSMWLSLAEIIAITKRSSQQFFADPELLKLHRANKCLYAKSGELLPVWKILVSYMGLNYAILRDAHEIYKLDKRFYQVSGSTQSYQVNPIDDSGLVTETFEFTGDTFLTSEKVTTKPNGIERISSEDHNFVVEPDHENFPEVNVFSQVSRMIAWFEERSFEWLEGEVLTVKIHESIATANGPNPNNALYLPREYDDPDVPSITLGDGDGVHLTNLALDADVSGHELGHHVIFQSVKSTQQVESADGVDDKTDHSGAIHEGLADFFMFAKTGDSCLGESICPGSGSICSQQGQCLRNADNNLVYATDEYWDIGNQLYHIKGQLISGLLWDIRIDENVTESDFDSLVVKAVDFLDARSTYSNLLLALVTSDHQFYQGKFACTIVDKAKARGFEDEINKIIPDCQNFDPANVTDEQTEAEPEDNSSEEGADGSSQIEFKKPEKRTKKEAKELCGTISYHGNTSSQQIPKLLFIFLFVLPLIVAQSLQRVFKS